MLSRNQSVSVILASMKTLACLVHVCLALTQIPCDCIFTHLIILAYAEHELVAIMTALIHHCSIMKMIPHMAVFFFFSIIVFSMVVYATMPMRQQMCAAEWLQLLY